MASNWLDNGGAFWLIGFAWCTAALFFYIASIRLGKFKGAETDGCLISVLCEMCVLIGGASGLLIPGRASLWASIIGCIALPAAALSLWSRKTAPRR